MRKLLSLIFILIILFTATQFLAGGRITTASDLLYRTPCDTPIRYRVGSIDPRFDIKQEKLIALSDRASRIWGQAYGRELFVYDPKGELSIDMVYDDRQTLNNKINEIEDKLSDNKNQLEPKLAEYEQQSDTFKKKIDALNNEIEEWNKKGGAPPDVYERLTRQQAELRKEADRLNIMAKSLNRSADQYNSEIGNLNKTVDTFNAALQVRPEEGVYIPLQNKIEIYFNISDEELVHTLAHELGHALGMDHNEAQDSIMYANTTSALQASDADKASLKVACEKRTVFEIARVRLQLMIHNYLRQREG
jgi:chaperonin cofactor prefoldin